MQHQLMNFLLIVVPLVGVGQNTRKTNEFLKHEYASALHSRDSILIVKNDLSSDYKEVGDQFERSLIIYFNSSLETMDSKKKVLWLFDLLSMLGISDTLSLIKQRVETMEIPTGVYGLMNPYFLQKGSSKAKGNPFDIQLDNLSIKKQNELLRSTNLNIRQEVNQLDSLNRELIEETLKLKKGHEDALVVNEKLIALNEYFTTLVNLLNDRLEQAKQHYKQEGPHGFNENYSLVFPDLFPKKVRILDEISTDFERQGSTYNETPPPLDSPVSPEDKAYSFTDESPEFPGGNAAMREFIRHNLKLPDAVTELGVEGKCYVTFVVGIDGEISSVEVKRGVTDCEDCDKEAVRMIESMPKWAPGKINGKPVNSWFNLPVSFKLPE